LVKFSQKNYFFGALPLSVRPSVFGFFFSIEVATEMKITDDQYFDRRISSVRPLVKVLLMNCVSYINKIYPSIKLFNGVV
jgi:hypothetical protein